jgi:hypothetical protein
MPKAKQPKVLSDTFEVATEEVAPQPTPEPKAKDKPKSNTYDVENGGVTLTVTDY